MSDSSYSPYTRIKQWEEAGASLLNAFKNYMDLCRDLGTHSLNEVAKPDDLAPRIESILEKVHTVISDQLPQITAILAQTRNKLISPTSCFPEEVLSEIFMNVIFDRNPTAPKPLSMEQGVRRIYRRLYSLVGVCSTWRDIIMAGGVFWSVIPMISSRPAEKQGPVELSLQRAGGCNLHLAVIADSPDTSKDLADVLAKYCPRLYMINLSIRKPQTIANAIDKLLEGTAESLVDLSIRCKNPGCSSSWLPSDEDYVVRLDHPRQMKFASLIKGLVAFRIYGTHFHWQTITFSTRLVELHIDSVTFGFDHAVYPFLQALSSASELRDLKIICPSTFYDPEWMPSTEVSPIVLPNLQSLFIENIYFNTLKLLLLMIAPGSHRLTLFLNSASLQNYLFDHDLAMIEASEFANVDIADLCGVLQRVPVDTLMLNGRWEQWPMGTTLRRLLGAIPNLKTLKLHGWKFDTDVWSSLRRPSDAQTGSQQRSDSYPALENLQLSAATILTNEGFRDMVSSHPLRKVVLALTTTAIQPDGPQREQLEESDSMVTWLRDNVPDFRLIDGEHFPPEFQSDEWRLW